MSLVLEADIHNPSKKSFYKSKEHYLEERKSVQEELAKRQDILAEDPTPSDTHQEEAKEKVNEEFKEPNRNFSEEKKSNSLTISPENDIIPDTADTRKQNTPHSRRLLLEALFIEKKDAQYSECKSLDVFTSQKDLLPPIETLRRKGSLYDSQTFEGDTNVKMLNRAMLPKNISVLKPLQPIRIKKMEALEISDDEKRANPRNSQRLDQGIELNLEVIVSNNSDHPTNQSFEERHLQMNESKIGETKLWTHTRKRSNSFSNATFSSYSSFNRGRFLSDQHSTECDAFYSIRSKING